MVLNREASYRSNTKQLINYDPSTTKRYGNTSIREERSLSSVDPRTVYPDQNETRGMRNTSA